VGTLDSAGNVINVDPIQVIFNDSMPWQAAHMLVAAYLVGRCFVIAFTVGAVATPIQFVIGDGLVVNRPTTQ